MVSLQTPNLQHPILIKYFINLRKLQNIKVRKNAADQNEKKKKKKKVKDQKRPTPKTKPPSRSSKPKTQPPAPESIHRPVSP
jgi:hypothetical protein